MKFRSALLSLLVVGGGVAAAQSFVASAPEPERKEIDLRRTPVQVVTTHKGSATVVISGMGTVVPARQVDLFAEVGGRVTAQFDGLREGAFVAKGTRLVRVDGRDYKYAVDTARASLAQARARLEEERSRKEVAERDFALLEKSLGAIDASIAPPVGGMVPPVVGTDDEPVFNPGDIARRVPQIQSAEANLRSVRSQLAQAELQVGRTKIIAPFDAVVTRKNVETGQLVGPATALATLVGTDVFHIKVAVPMSSLGAIAIPGTNTAATIGAPVRVIQTAGDVEVERQGHVVRLLGELQPEGRMAQLVVAVDDPFELALPPEQRKLPLLLGSYVRVEIEGERIDDVIEIPRSALRRDDTVWVVDADDELEIRDVKVRSRARGSVFLSEGIEPGDRVVTSRLAVPLANMPVRVVDSPTEPAAAEPAAAEPAAAEPAAAVETASAAEGVPAGVSGPPPAPTTPEGGA